MKGKEEGEEEKKEGRNQETLESILRAGLKSPNIKDS